MSEVALFDAPDTTDQSTKEEAEARANRIRAGMIAVTTLPAEIKDAWERHDWSALGYITWDGYIHGEFGEHRLPMITREQRRELTADLRSGGLTTYAIAAVLGVSDFAIRQDLKAVAIKIATADVDQNRADLEDIDNALNITPDRVIGADGKSYPTSRPKRQHQPEVVDAEVVPDDEPLPPRETVDPETLWSDDERVLVARLRAGETVVVSLRDHHRNLVAWAESNGMYVRIDRRTEWGNPFEMPGDGDRDTVIKNYEDHYLPHKPSLHAKIHELRGKALGCWCAPDPCHGDTLKNAVDAS